MSEEAALTSYIDPEQLKDDVALDVTKLDECLSRHASLYTHYAVQAARASRQYDRWKLAVEVLEAQLDNQHRTAQNEDGSKKVTEGTVKAAVVSDPRMKAARAKLIEAKQMKELCDSALLCFVHRKDMLLQLARDRAVERSGELRVSARVESAEAGKQSLLDAMARRREAA